MKNAIHLIELKRDQRALNLSTADRIGPPLKWAVACVSSMEYAFPVTSAWFDRLRSHRLFSVLLVLIGLCPLPRAIVDEQLPNGGNPGARGLASCTTFAVSMYDGYGDGWDNTVLHVGPFTFNLGSGSYGSSSVCLEPGVYYPYACDGDYLYEVSWTVGSVSGGADRSCSGATALVNTPAPTPAPTASPRPTSTYRPSLAPTLSPRPTLTSSTVKVSDEDNLHAAIRDSVTSELSTDIYLDRTLHIINIQNFAINGTGHKVDGQGATRCIYISRSVVDFNDLIVTNGKTDYFGGGIAMWGGTATLSSCHFIGNYVTGYSGIGGGIAMWGGTTATLTGCKFISNYVTGDYGFGGGLALTDGMATLTGCEIISNYVTGDGGNGGGLAMTDETATLTDCQFISNCVTGDDGTGGGVYIYGGNSALADCQASRNHVGKGGNGGGIFIESGSLTLSDCEVVDNPGDLGVGMFIYDAMTTTRRARPLGPHCGRPFYRAIRHSARPAPASSAAPPAY